MGDHDDDDDELAYCRSIGDIFIYRRRSSTVTDLMGKGLPSKTIYGVTPLTLSNWICRRKYSMYLGNIVRISRLVTLHGNL